MSGAHLHFQYESIEHQSNTALDGMWLFLAQEVLFFGGLFFAWLLCRHFHPLGFHRAAQQTDLLIGSINTVLLFTGSAVYAIGLRFIQADDQRRLVQCCLVAILLGCAFLVLKGLEWKVDLDKHMNPGVYFGLTGADAGGAQLFWVFYWVATVLHAVHMAVGIGLVTWLVLHARKGAYSAAWYTPVAVVGVYWSFVDAVWLVLYPLIYLVGRPLMLRIVRPVVLVWLALLVLMGLELGGSFLHLGHVFGGFLLVPAGIMVLLNGFFFMLVRRHGGLAPFFALAALFWLLILLGLGSMDAMTRTDYPVQVTEFP